MTSPGDPDPRYVEPTPVPRGRVQPRRPTSSSESGITWALVVLAIGAILLLLIMAPRPERAGAPRIERSTPSLELAADRVKRGTASHVGTDYGRGYLALPEHRWGRAGLRVEICGPADCIVRVSSDAGPDLAMQRAGRIADLNAWDFEHVCGCPSTDGLVDVTVRYLGRGITPARIATLPPTDTGP